jgi:hypothetical protein
MTPSAIKIVNALINRVKKMRRDAVRDRRMIEADDLVRILLNLINLRQKIERKAEEITDDGRIIDISQLFISNFFSYFN